MKFIVMFFCFFVSVSYAQEYSQIKMLKEVLESKGDHSKIKRHYCPTSVEEIQILSVAMESDLAPIAQELISKTTNQSLVPELIKICQKKSQNLKKLNEQDFANMNVEERKKEIHTRVNVNVLIETLGNLKDKRAIPILKSFLDDESFTYVASNALSKSGDEEVFAELMGRMEHQRNINLAGIKAHRLKKIVSEIDNAGTNQKKKGRLIGQIKGSRDAQVNELLKELALRHKDPDVRSQAGLALVNSIIANPKVADTNFLVQWANYIMEKNSVDDMSASWVVFAMDKSWNSKYIPPLISIMTKSHNEAARAYAANTFSKYKVQEAIPYLEQVMKEDKNLLVRGSAWDALEKTTGNKYFIEVYESDFRKKDPFLETIKRGEISHIKIIGTQRP